jgi:hypothetical protein
MAVRGNPEKIIAPAVNHQDPRRDREFAFGKKGIH